MSQPPAKSAREPQRIAKLLARAGIASRREIERMIADGRVARDGVAIDTPATLLTSLHGITVDGNPVQAAAPARLFLYHKPTGFLVTERDPAGRRTIYDQLPKDLPRLVPVGRLDLNTEGLLLLTSDGGLKRQLELPASGVERTYRARAYGEVSQAQLEELIHGVEIEGIRYGQIDANLERRTGANVWIEMTLTEGKNREVRRVLEHLGLQVGRLIRTRYGPFVLGDLPPGQVGEVRQADLIGFRQALAKGRASDPIAVRAQVAKVEREEEPAPVRTAATPRRPAVEPERPRRAAAPVRARRTEAREDRGADKALPARKARIDGIAAPASADRQASARGAARKGLPATSRDDRPVGPREAVRGRVLRPDRPESPPRGRPTAKPAAANRGKPPSGRAFAEEVDATPPSRPDKPPQRKAGWARPKPKAGPTGPKKPRR